jgi:MerR family transcriptional regulator/heat shock protein HspR
VGGLDRGLFSISVAAELAGLHPQTLRIYEWEGLLDPARSAGSTRRYSRRDINRLQEICALTADGLNLAGIRRVLQLQEETRQLQAEVARLRDLTVAPAPAERKSKQGVPWSNSSLIRAATASSRAGVAARPPADRCGVTAFLTGFSTWASNRVTGPEEFCPRGGSGRGG